MPARGQRKETEKMRRFFLVGILLLAGCQNVAGPFAARTPGRVDDPLFSIAEQQRRGRDRLALPEDNVAVAPPTGVQFPGPHGR
jgi:hypothetical protein